MTLITEELKANAEVFYGDELGQEKTKLLLEEVGLPCGLLPLKDIIECGYVEQTGFVWLKQKKKIQHCFEKIGKQVVNRDYACSDCVIRREGDGAPGVAQCRGSLRP